MVFRFFFPEPTPKQLLERIAFPLEKLPEVFTDAINAEAGTNIDQKMLNLFNQYIQLQTELSRLQSVSDESTSPEHTKACEAILDSIYKIVIDATLHAIHSNARGAAFVTITLNNDTNSKIALTDLLITWDRFPALRYCHPTTGVPITHIASRPSGGFDVLVDSGLVRPLAVYSHFAHLQLPAAARSAADAATDNLEKCELASFKPD